MATSSVNTVTKHSLYTVRNVQCFPLQIFTINKSLIAVKNAVFNSIQSFSLIVKQFFFIVTYGSEVGKIS